MEALMQMNGVAVLAELLVKSSILLGIALAASYLLKKRAPSLRHSILAVCITGLLVLPILTIAVPGWQLRILPALEPVTEHLVSEQLIEYRIVPIVEKSIHSEASDKPLVWHSAAVTPPPRPPLPPEEKADILPFVLPAAWFLGVLFLSIRIIAGLIGVSRLTRFGVSLSENPWRLLYRLFMRKSPIKRHVKLVKNRKVPVPMTWGVLNPVVLMPQDSASWSLHQCSSVLFHELAHVKRGDFLVRILARIACTVFWFNPLAWLAYRDMIRQQELACDQMVLQAGIKPSTYASSLLQVKLAAAGSHRLAAAAVGMAGDSALDERLTTILEKQTTHREVNMRTKLILIVLFIFTIAIVGTANPVQATSDNQEKKVEKQKEEKKVVWIEKKKGEEGEPKVVEIEEDDEMIVKTEDGKVLVKAPKGKHKKMIFIKEGDEKCKDGKKNVWVIAAPPIPPDMEELEQQMKAMGKALQAMELEKLHSLEAIKKQQEEVNKISDKKAREKMEEMLQKLHAQTEAAMKTQEESLQKMEAALQKMEYELQKKDKELREIEVNLDKMHDECDLHGEGEHEIVIAPGAPGKDHKLNIKINLDKKLDKKQMAALKSALKNLEKELPGQFDIDSKITEELQTITIAATKEINEKAHEALEEAMEKFEKEMEKILPHEHKVEKRIKKKVMIKKEKEEKK